MFNFTDEQKKQIVQACLTAFVTLVFAILGIMGYNVTTPVKPAPANIGARAVNFNGILCNSGETNCVESYGMNLLINTAAGTQTAKITASTGTFQHSGFDVFDAGTAISVTNGAVITPTATYQPLQSAGTVTPTLSITTTAGAAYTTGTRLYLVNTSNTSIILSDSGNVKLGAARTLGQYDTLELMFDGTYWLEFGFTDN